MTTQPEPHLRSAGGNPGLDAYKPAENVRLAERAIIGTIAGSAEAARLATTALEPENFYWPQHEHAFRAVTGLLEDGQPVDVVTVSRRLVRDGTSRPGTDVELAGMFAEAVPISSVTFHARIVREDAQRRRLHEACMRGIQATSSPACDVPEAAAKVAEQAHAIMEAVGTNNELAPLGDDLEQLIDEIESGITDAVPTGITDLDYLLHIRPGMLVTVGARSGIGKSMFGITMLRAIALHQHTPRPALYASIEMSRSELLSRVLAAESRVPLHALTPNAHNIRPNSAQWNHVAAAQPHVAAAPMIVDATKRGVTVSHLRSRLMREQARGRKPAALIVDHIHIMAAVQHAGSERRHQLDEISRGLKVLAEEMHIPVIALAQLNRKSDDRTDHVPAVGDLFEASAIEHHSDAIVLLHRPDKHKPDTPRAGEIDLILAKNRNGPQSTITAAYQGHYGRIADMSRREEPRG